MTSSFTLVQSCLLDGRGLHGLQDFNIHLFSYTLYWLFCVLLLLCSGAFWLLELEAEDGTLWNYFGSSKVHGAAVLVYLRYWYKPGLVFLYLLGGQKDFDLSTEILNSSFSKHPTLVMAKAVTWCLYIWFLYIKPAFISRHILVMLSCGLITKNRFWSFIFILLFKCAFKIVFNDF